MHNDTWSIKSANSFNDFLPVRLVRTPFKVGAHDVLQVDEPRLTGESSSVIWTNGKACHPNPAALSDLHRPLCCSDPDFVSGHDCLLVSK